jgi:O-antigen/teichoic acid export membrane protein
MPSIETLSLRTKVALSTTSQSLGNLLVALGGVAVVRITTHQLGPGDYGTFALIVTYVTLFTMLADMGVTAMTTIELGKGQADRSAVLSSALSFRLALSIILIPVIQGTAFLLYPHETSLFRAALGAMSFDTLFVTLQVTLSTAFIVRVRGDRIATLNTINRALYVLGVVIVAIKRGSYFDYVCAYVAADALVALIYVLAVKRSVLLTWSANLGQWWQMAKVALPLGTTQLIGGIYLWIDTILVSIICSKFQLGLYSLAFSALAVVLAVPNFLMQALIPSLVDIEPAKADRVVSRACYLAYCTGALLAVAGVVLRQDAVLALGGPKFLLASTPFAILFLTLPLTSLQTVIGYASIALDCYKRMLPLTVGTVVLNVAFNAVLIPKFGPTGAAAALLISEAIAVMAICPLFRRLTGIRIDFRMFWRPTVAALVVLPVALFGRASWESFNPILGVCVGGALVAVLYLASLGVVGGLPEEVWPYFAPRAG